MYIYLSYIIMTYLQHTKVVHMTEQEKQEWLARYEKDDKWRSAWNALMNNKELMRKKYPLQTQLEYIERRAEIANQRIAKLIKQADLGKI